MELEEFALRHLRLADAVPMLEWLNDKTTTQYLQLGGKDYTIEDAESFIKEAKDESINIHRAICNRYEDYVGTVSLKNIDRKKKTAEYAITIHPKWQGSGAAWVGTDKILQLAFSQLDLENVYLYVSTENKRAIRFYEKYGFKYSNTSLLEPGEDKTVLWYRYERSSFFEKRTQVAPEKKKLVFFFSKRQHIGGGLIFLLGLARYIGTRSDYEVYYINYKNPATDSLFSDDSVHFCDIRKVDFSEFEGADFIVPLNYIFFLLEKISDFKYGRILVFDWHPNLGEYLSNQLFYKRNSISTLLLRFSSKDGVAYMDESCYLALRRFNEDLKKGPIVPVFSSSPRKECCERNLIPSDRINICWLGRLDSDKIFSLINLLDNLKKINTEKKIDIHIIGDGNARNRINIDRYSPKIRFIFTSYLIGEERDKYITENADIVVAMGISALDTSNLSIPTVIPLVSNSAFKNDEYVFLFDIKGYSLGWTSREKEDLNCTSYTLQEVIDQVYTENGKVELGRKCNEFNLNNFNIKQSAELLLEAINNSQLTTSDCLDLPVIKEQLRKYNIYKSVRRNRTYDEYILFNQKLNRMKGKNILGKVSVLSSWVISKGIKKAEEISRKSKSTIRDLINKPSRENLEKYRKVQEQYPAKITVIKKIYQEKGIIRALFPVIFSSVFPTEPIFTRMLEDDIFDPYILVTVDMQRPWELRMATYKNTFQELSEKYPGRVIQGFDEKSNSYVEPTEDFQLVFYNNPYSKMANKYHHITYFLDKNVLNLYVNYGFAAVKYGRTIMKTDFYNYLWCACIDSYLNLSDLKKYEPIKGSNGLVTGYLKMDRLAGVQEHPRKRPRIIISPHHTVLGWKSLNISNFFKYADFFVDLPKRFPQIDFVFRPHPLLFSNLTSNNIWSEEDVSLYLDRMLESPNISYDHSGDYFELFNNSDGMIHDCSSFIGEYLFTEKPCCYMLKSEKEIKEVMNPMGIECMKHYYHAFSEQDILNFIETVVLEGKDPLKESRERFSREQLKFNYPNATDTVIHLIKETLCEA